MRSFAKLEREQFPKEPQLTRSAGISGRLGLAIVVAYRDVQTAAQQSIDQFQRVLAEPFPKFPGKGDKLERGFQAVSALLLRHLDLSQAVSEALNRNANALGKTRLDSTHLEMLRSPPKSAK